MGADIHIFLEMSSAYDKSDKFTNLDYYEYLRENDVINYVRLNSFEGRSYPLFDILESHIQQNGFPYRASEVFNQEWEEWKDCGGYGVNYLSLKELRKFWEENLLESLYNPEKSLEENDVSLIMYQFLNDILNHYLNWKEHNLRDVSADLEGEEGTNVYILYFFDR